MLCPFKINLLTVPKLRTPLDVHPSPRVPLLKLTPRVLPRFTMTCMMALYMLWNIEARSRGEGWGWNTDPFVDQSSSMGKGGYKMDFPMTPCVTSLLWGIPS